MSPVLRPPIAADMPVVASLLEGVTQQLRAGDQDLYLQGPSDANRHSTCLLAELDGQVVGVVAGGGLNLDWSDLQVTEREFTQRIGLLDFVAVHPDHHGLGLGTLLVESLEAQFRDRGCRLMVAKIAAGKREVIPVYTRWGWSVGGRGAGVAIEFEPGPVVVAEDNATRVAWIALHPGVRQVSRRGFGPVVAGVFD